MNSFELARQIRRDVVTMCHRAKTAHVASCLSCIDILAVWHAAQHDTPLIVSKGHAAAAAYAALAEVGKFDRSELDHFGEPGALLECTHVSASVPGVVHSTGSLGHGLPVACGMALADPQRGAVVLMSDAELQCGTTWEAAMFARQRKLPVVAIIDDNRWQALGRTAGIVETTFPMWRAYGCDGHDHDDLDAALGVAFASIERLGPIAIIANTLKGKGVSFMEDDPLLWHYRAPDEEELHRALAEIG